MELNVSEVTGCGKKMVLWLRVKELNLVLIIQEHIWTAESFYQTFVLRAYRKLNLVLIENEFFQL